MTIRHFYIFIAVNDENGMTNAAKKLHMTQPSVSQAIKEMEEYYSVHLFERLGKKLYLSAAGHELLGYARHIVSLAQQTNLAMQGFSEEMRVRVGASLTIGESILIKLLTEFHNAQPRIKIISHIHNTSKLEEMLLKDELDIALVEGKINSKNIIERWVMDDELVLVASPYNAYKLDVIKEGFFHCKMDKLSKLPFILREEGSGTRILFEQKMAASGIDFETVGIYNNSNTIKQAVTAGLGFSAISKRLVEKELHSGELWKLIVPGFNMTRSFRLVYHKNKFVTPQMKKFMDLII